MIGSLAVRLTAGIGSWRGKFPEEGTINGPYNAREYAHLHAA